MTLIHGMSRPIGAHFHVPHGLSNAMLLPVTTTRTTPGALPHRAPSTRRTAGRVRHVWQKVLTPSLAALAAQVVTAFSLPGAPARYADCSRVMGFSTEADDEAAAGAKLLDGLRSLCAELQVPHACMHLSASPSPSPSR